MHLGIKYLLNGLTASPADGLQKYVPSWIFVQSSIKLLYDISRVVGISQIRAPISHQRSNTQHIRQRRYCRSQQRNRRRRNCPNSPPANTQPRKVLIGQVTRPLRKATTCSWTRSFHVANTQSVSTKARPSRNPISCATRSQPAERIVQQSGTGWWWER